ncbi:response regulator [Hydrogenophaga laconesensis]|uniref:Two-component system response regulator BaeR n=1 Tax=Hydrogenophaga laconesensis TaxID=1805971 RepID=A0ABU1V9R4_9BURK|nr:response regulator [Hydrogenophaga laconesensis]MDR7094201.1 two-component system response regulator BaeR [Hydrogenophaga laconesensis]
MPDRILIVEDESKIAGVLVDYLTKSGYHVHHITRGDEVEDWLAHHPVDLVLLDLMLPGKSGLDICKALRAGTPGQQAPAIIMVTARVEEIDRLLGLELGADDYICKPFSPREVVARVKAVLRRGTHAVATPDELPHGLKLEDAAWRATIAGHDLGLTAVEYQLLKVLSARPGRIFSREQLMDSMYQDERIVSDRTVDSHIKKLRRKIQEQLPDQELIHSVYGLGYKYEA